MKYNFDEIVNRENTDSLKWDMRQEVFGRADVVPLWVADMDFKTPDFIMDAVRKRTEHEVLGYTMRPDSFFIAARDWLKRRNNWDTDIKDMVFTPGIVAALNFAVEALSNPNDKIIVQTPVYTPFFDAVKNNGRKLIENPLIEKDGYYTIDFDDLERKLADNVKLFILCSPHNPIGRVWTKDELLRMGELCVKYNVKIISDEIHSDLVYNTHKHTHLASLSTNIAQLTLTCFAPSKTFNTAGLFTAIVHSLNADILAAFNKRIELAHIGMGNIFGNIALEAAYTYGDKWLDELLKYIEANMEWTKLFFDENIPTIKSRKSEGTYMMWLDFREFSIKKQSELNDFLVNDAKIGLNNGLLFGLEGKGFMRLNVACPRVILETGMNQLKEACQNLK